MKNARRFSPSSALGFSLLELAISLFVLALLLGGVLLPLRTQLEERKILETKRLLDEAQQALVGYAAANGYFPCPANGTSNGQEPAGTDHDTGSCPSWHGFLPAVALGLRAVDSQGYAVDAWGLGVNRVRYAVSNATVAGITQAFTRTNGLRSIPLTTLAASRLFHVCQSGAGVTADTDCGTAVTLASNAIVVVWSVGPNAAVGGTSVHEAQNPNPNGGSADRIFVSRTQSDVPGHEFDDLVTWVPTVALVHRLLLAGQVTPAAHMAATPLP